jgi:hypothetical protein
LFSGHSMNLTPRTLFQDLYTFAGILKKPVNFVLFSQILSGMMKRKWRQFKRTCASSINHRGKQRSREAIRVRGCFVMMCYGSVQKCYIYNFLLRKIRKLETYSRLEIDEMSFWIRMSRILVQMIPVYLKA